jgi:CRISPR-associated endoribonuclease Cas6
MQFKLTLQCLDPNPVIPINYQYELSAWIYSVIERADEQYAAFLHQEGFVSDGLKNFKMFCFSQLNFLEFAIVGDRLHIKKPTVSMVIGFYVDRSAETFIRGLFSDIHLTLGDRRSRARMQVREVQLIKTTLSPQGGKVRFRTKSPLMLGRKLADGKEEYLHPDEPDYPRLFFHNLMEKYKAAHKDKEMPSDWNTHDFHFKWVGKDPRSKLITIKEGKDAETRVRGYQFDFELDAPVELMELGLLAGFGRMNGEGFGCATVV